MRTAALERVVQRAGARRLSRQAEACALCAAPLPEDHPHMLDTQAAARPLCVCRACSVLFDRPAASQGRYRLIPHRVAPLPGVNPAHLGAPVGLAFFVLSDDGAVTAHYPSPAGATRWEVDNSRWETALATCPALKDLQPEVEALLVNTAGNRSEAWAVPISDCYRLVALVRQNWEGLSGGDKVWPAVAEFFDELRSSYGKNTSR